MIAGDDTIGDARAPQKTCPLCAISGHYVIGSKLSQIYWALLELDPYKAIDQQICFLRNRRRAIMAYTLDQFAADCRTALLKDAGPTGRERVRQFTEKACTDRNFIARHLGPDVDAERTILYEDPDLHFCILGHVYKGAKTSAPHDHGPSWAIYGQATGETEMTDWRLVERPTNGKPGKVAKVRTYKMTPGMAHLYGEGDLHSPRRESETRLIRIEGIDLSKVKRDKYDPAEGR